MSGFSVYPNAIDGAAELPPSTDQITEITAEVVNRQRDAILSVEGELGILPSGTFGTVRARLDALDGLIATLQQQISGLVVSVFDEGTLVLNQVNQFDFIGPGVTVTPNAITGRVDVNITGSGGTSIEQVQESLPVLANGQTAFTLSQVPIDSTAVQMYVNGSKQQFGVSYNVISDAVTYTGTPLITTDVVEFWYISDAPGAIGQEQETLPVTINGQTAFTLATDPADPTAVELFVNGDKQEYGVDYTVTGLNVSWLGFALITTDVVEAWYITSTVVIGGGSQTLSQTLTLGNTTSGNNIILSGGDNINAAGGTIDLADNTSVTGDLSVSGKLTVTGLIDPTGLVLDPQGSDPIPGSSSGIWVDNSSPTNLFFTDDAGTAFQLNGAAGSQDLATTLGIGNITGGNNIVITSGDQIVGQAEVNVPIFGGASTSATKGGDVGIFAGSNTGTGNGGAAFVTGGNSTSAIGGNVEIGTGSGAAAGDSGDFIVRVGSIDALELIESASGELTVQFGNGFNPVTLQREPSLSVPSTFNFFGQDAGAATAFAGGDVIVTAGTGGSTGSGGDVQVRGGLPQGPGNGGDVFVIGENAAVGGNGGNIFALAGNGFNGGTVYLRTGSGTSNDGYIGLDGYIDVLNNKITKLALPTAPEDAANKAYVDSLSGISNREFAFKLTGLFSGAGVPGTFEPPRPVLNNATINSVTLLRRNPGTSGTTRVDLLVNGASIFASDPAKPQVAFTDPTNAINTVTSFTSAALSVNDTLDVELETVEAGSAEDLIVIVRVTES